MTRVQYIRPFDDSKAVDTGFRGYRAQFLSHLESAVLINSHIEEGGCGPGLHYHHVDQLYYLIEGSMNVQLGHDVSHITAGTLVFIPAGLAHRNWNDGPGAETHFEMLIPAPSPIAQIAYMVDTPDEVPAPHRADRRAYTRSVHIAALSEQMPGLRVQSLATPGQGSVHTVVNYMEVDSGSAGPGTHIHDFDQYYLVLEGELTVEIGLEKYVAPPHTLVVLPAGVPHRQYNEGTITEKHLAVLAPAPEPGKPWDRGVNLGANGDDLTGPQSVFAPAQRETP
ncbi:cupin domain-containing protein [Mycobacterium sp.]|uniref:cupin domain-containing protein n=1 Tax=Mycobacterium sp. TaxID=1785 RepID=UPI002C264A63|nr:cupin domain-containing protein [Mycobacterium sp.]HKP41605.1 cupin domain-containing protein [Mycobacterium sp.]